MTEPVPGGSPRLDGKTVLVTGGTRGIGRSIAEACARAGAAVSVLARKPDELDETASALGDLGARVVVTAGSAGDPSAIERAVAATVDELGSLDFLANNAAANPVISPMIEIDPRAVRKILQVNVEGPLLLAQAAWRAWMRDHGGVILNVASIGGLRPGPFIGTYNVSKAALLHLTRQLAHELAPGVRVNALAPGLVKTDMARALWEPDEEGAAATIPLARIGVPDDVGAAALFLLSDAGSWITGTTLVVDGGMMLV